MPLKEDDRYTLDEDGLWVEHVGSWAIEKHKIVTDYIRASGAARRKYLNSGTSYIDVFCGPGRFQIRDTHKFIDGSPVAAFEKAKSSLALSALCMFRMPMPTSWQALRSAWLLPALQRKQSLGLHRRQCVRL